MTYENRLNKKEDETKKAADEFKAFHNKIKYLSHYTKSFIGNKKHPLGVK
jgi:hypothetical protein